MSSKARIRNLKAKLKKATKKQKRQKENDRLHILAEASLVEHGALFGTHNLNVKKFGENFVNFDFFVFKTSFPAQCVAPFGACL